MKLGKYILGLALVAAGLTSCDTDNVGAIYDAPAMSNLSFQSKTITQETEGDALTVPVVITRTYSTDSYSTTVNVNMTNDKAKLRSNQVSFGPKEQSDTLYIDATNLDWGDECVCTLSLPDVDVQGASPFATPIHQVVVTIKKPALVSAGTCTITDYTWFEEPVTVENVPIINVEGTNKYRIVSPLYYLYNGILDDPDTSNFEFTLNKDGKISIEDGLNLNWWGYYGYFNAASYSGYCFVEYGEGNTYTVNQLLYYAAGGNLYIGCVFTFVWDKPAQ